MQGVCVCFQVIVLCLCVIPRILEEAWKCPLHSQRFIVEMIFMEGIPLLGPVGGLQLLRMSLPCCSHSSPLRQCRAHCCLFPHHTPMAGWELGWGGCMYQSEGHITAPSLTSGVCTEGAWFGLPPWAPGRGPAPHLHPKILLTQQGAYHARPIDSSASCALGGSASMSVCRCVLCMLASMSGCVSHSHVMNFLYLVCISEKV